MFVYHDMEIDENGDKDTDTNIFGELESVLGIMRVKRIFDVYKRIDKEGETFRILEMCDEWYGMELTEDICRDLSKLFSAIADKIKEEN